MQKTFFLVQKLLLSPRLHALEQQLLAIWAYQALLQMETLTGDSHTSCQDAFDHGGSTPPYWNENNISIIGPNLGLLAHSSPTGMGGLLCPQALDRSNDAEGDYLLPDSMITLKSPLGINFRSAKGTGPLYRQQRCWRAAAVRHLTSSLIIDRTQESSKLSQLQAIILALGCPGQSIP